MDAIRNTNKNIQKHQILTNNSLLVDGTFQFSRTIVKFAQGKR